MATLENQIQRPPTHWKGPLRSLQCDGTGKRSCTKRMEVPRLSRRQMVVRSSSGSGGAPPPPPGQLDRRELLARALLAALAGDQAAERLRLGAPPGRRPPRRSALRGLIGLTGAAGLVASTAAAAAAAAPARPSRQGEVARSDEEWRAALGPEAYHVLRRETTERPFSSPLLHEARAGVFVCAGCGAELFLSAAKYDSGTGEGGQAQRLLGQAWPGRRSGVACTAVVLLEFALAPTPPHPPNTHNPPLTNPHARAHAPSRLAILSRRAA